MPLSPKVMLFDDIELHWEAGLWIEEQVLVAARRRSCEYNAGVFAILNESSEPGITRGRPISNHRPGFKYRDSIDARGIGFN